MLRFGINRLFQRRDACLGRAAVLIATAAGGADSPNQFAVHNNRDAAFNWDRAGEAKNAKAFPARSDGVLERFCRAAEKGRRFRFVHRDFDAAQLGVRHPFEIHEVATGIDDRDCHGPIVLASLGNGRSRLRGRSICPNIEARDGLLSSGMEGGMREGYEKLDELLKSL